MIKEGDRVRVYYNLHKKLLSVQTLKEQIHYNNGLPGIPRQVWRVTDHVLNIGLRDVRFAVS